jgi:hypothetical protein
MRGLLTAMIRQADKVEKFKLSQNPSDAYMPSTTMHKVEY